MAFSRTLYWLALGILPLSVWAGKVDQCHRLHDDARYREAMVCYMQPELVTHPVVMNIIGYMYSKGQGVPADPEEALRWYHRSADAGFAAAQFNIGILYEQGHGVPQDASEAAKWFTKAAEQQYPNAEEKMGYFYASGTGVQQDYREAMKWFRRAVEHGNTSACSSIGILYDKGDGVPIDHNRAVQYYIMGAMGGDAQAQALLAFKYLLGGGLSKDKRRAAYWFEQAANNGYPVAMQQMVKIYTYGRYGYDRDPEKAEYWRNRYNQTIDEQRKTGSRSVEPPLPFSLPSLTD